MNGSVLMLSFLHILTYSESLVVYCKRSKRVSFETIGRYLLVYAFKIQTVLNVQTLVGKNEQQRAKKLWLTY